MSALIRLNLVALGVAASLCFPGGSAVDAADKVEKPIPVDELKKGLMTALGDSFEYLGGEIGRTKTRVGSWGAERFWFAKVRVKAAGEFAIACTITFDFPAEPQKFGPLPDKGVYLIPIKIGNRDTPHVIRPAGWGGAAYPHANVGDTLIIPIHIDRFRTGHSFAKLDTKKQEVAAFFSVAGETQHERYMKLAAAKPVVRNDAADQLDLLASWGSSGVNRSGTEAHHSLTGYLEFKKPGEFNLTGRLAEADEKAAGAGMAFRVLPKDKPVAVCLEYFDYREHTGASTSLSSSSIGSGTLEARVGDRVLIGCGGYVGPVREKAEEYRPGVVVVQAFKAVPPYTPEPKK